MTFTATDEDKERARDKDVEIKTKVKKKLAEHYPFKSVIGRELLCGDQYITTWIYVYD